MLLHLRLVRRRWPSRWPGSAGRRDLFLGRAHRCTLSTARRARCCSCSLPSSPDPEVPPVNPYLNLPGAMGATANLVAGMVTTDDVARSLAERD